MREQRQRKALSVNRREELYAEPQLRKEYAPSPKRARSRRRPRKDGPKGRGAS